MNGLAGSHRYDGLEGHPAGIAVARTGDLGHCIRPAGGNRFSVLPSTRHRDRRRLSLPGYCGWPLPFLPLWP